MTWVDMPDRVESVAPNQLVPAETRSGPPRVLVVDDEPLICQAFFMILARVGYEPYVAKTGEAALATIRERAIDVLLLDLHIPDMRGDVIFEVATSVQPHLRTHTLFMTGDITDRAEKLIAACGCEFLRKPFDLALMIDAVAALAPRTHDQSA